LATTGASTPDHLKDRILVQHPFLVNQPVREMDHLQTTEGNTFIRLLAQFIRQHEKALATSMQLAIHRRNSSASLNAPSASVSGLSNANQTSSSNPAGASLAAALSSFTGLHFRSYSPKAAHLTLTPHHLFYLLSQIEELEIDVGSMNVRVESIHNDASTSNYVSFLDSYKPQQGRSDRDSIHSVSSMRSVMSTMTSFWSNLGLSLASKNEKALAQREADLKYLYSSFTKLPSLRMTADHKTPLVKGFEEFPFDTAVPLYSFKNIQHLEIIDLDFRSFYGWDRLADQLTALHLKRAHLDDPADLLVDIVLDDAEKRRRRSTKGGKGTSTPTSSWTMPSTPRGEYDLAMHSDPGSPTSASPKPDEYGFRREAAAVVGSASPRRPGPGRPVSSYRHTRTYSSKVVRSGSGSSNSSEYSLHPYRGDSSSSLMTLNTLAPGKWQRLTVLSLSDCGLTHLSAKSLAPVAPSLRSLILSSNLFTEIPDCLAALTRLTSLDLSHCMINSLQSLARSPLPAITTIVLRSNRLQSLAGVERLLSLENIDVRDNGLTDVMEAARLTGLPNIRQAWFKRNPFVRNTPEYRVKIFNLFRSTPGYVEDVCLDGNGPGYSERKQLVERVPEVERRMTQPVVRIAEAPVPVHSETGSSEPHEVPEIFKASSRRKRNSRRRIVDLAHDDSPWRPDGEVTIVSRPSVDARRSTDGATATSTGTKVPADDGIISLDKKAVGYSEDTQDDITVREGLLLPLATPEEDYRNQAETLRRELGSNWLNALDDTWHNSHHLDMQHIQPIGHAPGLHRANLNTMVVTSGRTLG
jgi:Leucine-rich repeat (LRR) protein